MCVEHCELADMHMQDLRVEVRIENVVMNVDVGETLKRKDDYLHTEHYKVKR